MRGPYGKLRRRLAKRLPNMALARIHNVPLTWAVCQKLESAINAQTGRTSRFQGSWNLTPSFKIGDWAYWKGLVAIEDLEGRYKGEVTAILAYNTKTTVAWAKLFRWLHN